ncbi:MAG TPA: CRTAC1 family protein [Planctomycetes bacterium]|nr:CRTAC1 family protein [Planctomycetota bacterium]HIL38580.1 CRTAC1 family protein [Planctomycetota bacterium]
MDQRLILPLLLASWMGCSDSPTNPQPDTSAAGDTASSQRPVAPARLFPDSLASSKAGWDDLRGRLDPGPRGDAWQAESVAERSEQALNYLLRVLLADRADNLKGLVGAKFTGACALVPTEWAAIGPLGDLSVREGIGSGSFGAQEVVGLFRDLIQPWQGTPARLTVHCTATEDLGAAIWRTTLGVRIGGETAAGEMLQRQATVVIQWRVAKRFLLLGIESCRLEEALLKAPIYQEITRASLAGSSLGGPANLFGAVEHTRRMDVQVAASAVALGMHGIGVGDLDGDGLEDLYVARHSGVPNHYLLAKAGGGFRDAPPGHGADLLEDTAGVLICDLDGDGARDLALAVFDEVVVLWNDGQGRFPVYTALECEGGAQVYSIVAGDADGDGDLDLYDTRYHRGDHQASPPLPYHDAHNGAENHFWRNDGQRGFQDQTAQAGFSEGNDRYSLAALWHDLDGDGDLDLYVTNDFGRNNLYRNEGGTFRDVADQAGGLDMAAGMGVSVADVNRDGFSDLYISNMWSAAGSRVTREVRFMQRHPEEVRRMYSHHAAGNTLLLGEGQGKFRDASSAMGLSPGGWSWGSILMDFDNDGWSDAFVPNGFTTMRSDKEAASYFWRVVVESSPAKPPLTSEYQRHWQFLTHLGQVEAWSLAGNEPNYAYWNARGRFVDVSVALGLDHVEDGRSALAVDLDGDGRLDLVTKNRTAPLVRVLRNTHPSAGNFVSIELVGQAPNTEGVGAQVSVRASGHANTRTVHAGEGYLASASKRLHFGLGKAGEIQGVQVRWPDGQVKEYGALPMGQLLRLHQDGRVLESNPKAAKAVTRSKVIPEGLRPVRSRVPLLVTIPWSGWELPRFDGTSIATGSTAGPMAVVAWAGWDDPSRQLLRELGAQGKRLAAGNIHLHPLSLDEPQALDWIQADIKKAGLAEIGGRADTRTRGLLDVLVGLSIGPYESLELPIVVLFDATGRLAVLHLGPDVSAAAVLQDLETMGSETLGRYPTRLGGGQWLRIHPERPLEAIAGYLARNGEAHLANSVASDLDASQATGPQGKD